VIEATCVPTRRDGLLDYRLADEMVVYDPVSSQAAALNTTASTLWQLCDGTRNVDALCQEMAQRFDVSLDEAQQSIRASLDQLCQLGLLRI
jgi:PqqD family protein of HPr-rel-A system